MLDKMANNTFFLTAKEKVHLESKGYVLKCEKCGETLDYEQQVISRSRKEKRLYYHVGCWERLFID